MKKTLSYFLLILFLPLVAASCQKRSTGINGSEDGGVEDFPNTIGSRFVYSYFDSVSMASDTVVASIVGMTALDGTPACQSLSGRKEATVWEYTYSSKTDSKYVYVSGDTVKICSDLNTWWGNTFYVFPLKVGKGWKGDFPTDTSTVVDRVAISVPAGEFSHAFVIEEKWGALNDYGHVLTWLVPKVGMIKTHRRGWSFGLANETWELIEYHICCPK
jgi:hypothetical protein